MTTAVAVREKPILFSGPMVRAILDGRKKQTRRVMKPQPEDVIDRNRPLGYRLPGNVSIPINLANVNDSVLVREHTLPQCPYGVPGDRLWVRETWQYFGGDEDLYQKERGAVAYCATWESDRCLWKEGMAEPTALDYWPDVWRPSIFMPRWASRISLEITEVRVQRVQEISEEDAIAEGISEDRGAYQNYFLKNAPPNQTPRSSFYSLWDSINLKRGFGWESNPWVWCVSFKSRP